MENSGQNENKAKIVEEKKAEENPMINDKIFKYIYFIITYDKSKQLKAYLSPEYKGFDTLEKINDNSFDAENGLFTSDVYRFKLMEEGLKLKEGQKEYQIPVYIENEKYQYIIKARDLKRDYYEYNFEIKEIDVLLLDYQKQFEIYLDILRNKFQKKQNTPENEDFILSTQSLLTGPNKKYNFLFFLSIFLECFSTKYINRHLLLFKPEKIIGLGEVANKKINPMKNILNILAKKPERIHIENEKDRQKTIDTFYSIVLYFNLHFQKEKVEEMIENEEIFGHLSEKLIKCSTFYEGLILPKKNVVILINKIDDYNQVLNVLPFLGKDVILFLEVINDEKDFIKNLIQKEKTKIEAENQQIKDKKKKKEIPVIEIENYVQPKKEDDIIQINGIVNELINYQQENGIFYIKFSYSFFEKYIDFNNGVNYDNIGLIKNIIDNYKKCDKTFKCKNNLNDLIHDNGVNLAKKGLLKNIELLEFIKTDVYYHEKNYESKRSIDVLNGIDISSLEKNFFKTWKQINFCQMFKNNLNNFLKKVSLLIKEMKDFELLFSFYDFYQDKEYKYESIYAMQKRFVEIFNTYSNEKCPNFTNDIAKLIYWSDKKNVNLKKFLKDDIQVLLDVEKVNEIYLKLIDEHQDLSKEIKEIIIEFFTTNNNSEPTKLLYLIKNCQKLRGDIFTKINKFIIKEEDFLKIEENENLKFFKGLVNEKLLEKANQYKGAVYISKAFMAISGLEAKIESYDIKYSDLILYFQDETNTKVEEILKDRLNYIYISEEDKAKKMFDKLKKKFQEIKEIIKELDLLCRDFSDFFFNSHKEDIKKIAEICIHLKADSLNYFDNNCKNDYDNYKKYLKDAEIRNKKKKSKFYLEIFETEGKISNEKNEIEVLNETEKKFNELKVLFEKDGINKIDPKFLENYLRPFRNNNENLESEVEKEIKTLIDIFEIKDETNVKEILEGITLINKKKYFFDIAAAVNTFIDNLKVPKTNFFEDIKDITKKLQEKKDIDTIRNCKNKLIELKIMDEGEKDNKLIEILFEFKKQPESIIFLFKTSIQDCRNLQEVATQSDNNYVNVNDLLDMEKCIEFCLNIGKLEDLKNINDNEIINKLKENVSKNEGILVYIQSYVNNYGQIKMLQGSLDKSEALKYIVQGLFNSSTYVLSNNEKDKFKCTYIDKEKNNQVELKMEDIKGYRERALLSKKITPDYKYFIETITEIINISNILEEVSMKGYPEIITIKMNLKVNVINNDKEMKIEPIKEYYLDDDNSKKDYQEIRERLKSILSDLKTRQINAYENIPVIRYLYGRQFNLLSNNFKTKDDNIIPLLKYITNDIYKKGLDKFKPQESGQKIQDNINNCENYLNEVLKINNLNLKKIYETTIIKQKDKSGKYQGVYTYLTEKLEKELYQIYKYLTGNNPIAQNVLLCNKDTTSEEITSFLYRAIKCEFESCFIVGGIELLGNNQKVTILDLLNHLFPKGDEKINSCLIFLYSNKNSDIYRNLEMKKYRKVLELKKNVFEALKYEENNIEIIKSDKSGVGKSTQIRQDIEKSGKKYIYFPFGGVFTRDDIIERLKNLKIDCNCILHLDLYNTDQITLMMEFLFSMLITRFYGQNVDIFFLSKEIHIKVEIPNTFIDFFEKFQILSLFPTKEIKIANLAPLIVPKELDSDIQLVANYLKAMEEDKINRFDLIFPNITPVDFEKRVYFIKKKKFSTSVKAEVLSQEECQKLIFNSIKEEIPEPTYYQIDSFIKILAIQLKKLNQNFFLNAHTLLISGRQNLYLIRKSIVENFIKLTKHFTKGAFTDLIKGQNIVHKTLFGQYNEGEDINKAINNLANDEHEVISFEKIDPSLLFFHEGDGQLFSIITNKKQSDKEYKDLLAIKNSQSFDEKSKINELPDYKDEKKFTKEKFLEELKEILDIPNPVKKGTGSDKISLEEITDNYVITPDNFVKMVLILLRLRSNIPVIMMGETGCGKTSLIRKLSEMKNNGDKKKMKILNIHAGTNDKDIVSFLYENVIPEAKEIANKEKEQKEKYQNQHQFFNETKLWVFLDEINTCKSMGLISELMCKHTCQGKPLPSNIVFIAACNPYRQRENKGNKDANKFGLDVIQAHKQIKFLNAKELEDIKRKRDSNLVYTVNPLPHSLLNFVFDFGSVKPKDEENYIRNIIKDALNKKYYKDKPIPEKENDEDEQIKNLKDLASNMIIVSQNYIRDFNDKSAVSLREIRRFNIFYEFFYDYLKKRKEIYSKENENQFYEEDKDFYNNLDDYKMQVYGVNLSIFVCYYLKITDKEKRIGLHQKMNELFKKFDKSFEDKDFLDLPKKEEAFIVNNIKLNKGIAKNRALLENLFSIFVAINNKVPIFIVGKPGCSKSLSVQLITKSMQGNVSESYFFKNLPKILVHSYQGSMASTSKGVENIFKIARSVYNNLKQEDKKNNISLIFFDEMGLAEHSPNNPLKVIHSELEYDQNTGDNQVAFVGISNWILDAAKMNRGISISIPEADEEDNMETSLTIGKSYDEKLAIRHKDFFENLGKSYFKYKLYLKEKHNLDGKEDFHGNRDFYHLVKNSSRNIIEKDKNNQLNDMTLLESAVDSIERNFSGIQFEKEKTSLEIYKGIFKEMYPECQVVKEYDVLKRIKENINDLNSRYLLVFSKSSISTFLLSSILSDEKKDYNFYIGSQFEEDLNTEEYALKVLNKIQVHMERGNILILKNLDSVYPSMYDLFNQNFTILSNKSYARLAVGSNTNTFAYVNKDFRCIVTADIEEINNEEAPFLNRFEKHIMSFEYLLSQELIKEAEKIKSVLDKIVKCNDTKFKAIPYDLGKLLVNNSIEEIQGLIYEANKKGLNKEKMNEYILSKFALTLPQDLIINMKINGLLKNKDKSFKKMLELYNKGEHSNISNFLKIMNNYKNIIYTFSNNLEDMKNIHGINNELVGTIEKDNIKQIIMSSIKCENDLETEVDNFFNEKNYKICIVKFMPYEGSLMNYLKYFIENKEKDLGDKNDSKKVFIFIVYMTRVMKKDLKEIEKKPLKEQIEIRKKIMDESLSHLSGYYQVFIDNLNGDENLKIEKIMNMNQNELFNALVNPDEELCSSIFHTISYMNYNIIAPYKGLNGDNYVELIIKFIYNNKRLRDLINECIFSKSLNKEEDIMTKIFQDKNSFDEKGIEIISVIKKYLSKLYTSQLNLLYFKAEKEQFFSSLLSNSLNQKIWQCEKTNLDNKGEKISATKEEISEDKTIVEKLAKSYLEDIIYNDGFTRITEKQFANKVDIVFGLNVPGIKSVFEKIIKSVNENIIKNYRNNENNLRNYIDKEEDIINEKGNYFNDLKMNNNSLVNIFNKEPQIIKIIEIMKSNQEGKGNLINLIINDYYTLFLNNNISKKRNKKEEENEEEKFLNIDNLDNNIRFLNLMVSLRNDIINKNFNNYIKEEEIIDYIANNINWVESYSEEITSLQQIFLKLSLKIPEFYEQIESIINKKQIEYEISDRNPQYTSIVNEAFFLSLDSILRVITSKEDVYNLNQDEFFALLSTNKEVLQDALQLENNLILRSKEVFSLQEILKLINAFYLNNLASIENVKTIIKYFGEQTIYVQNKMEKKLCDNFNDFYKFLVEKLGKAKKNKNFDFHKVLSYIFLNEYLKITFYEFRKLLLETILENNEFIANNSQIIKIILENVISSNPLDMKSNFDLLKEEESEMIKILNNQKNIILDEVIMNILEGKISVYFEWIPTLPDCTLKELFPTYLKNNKEKYRMLLDESYKIFNQTIKFLDSISNSNNEKENQKENINLCKLYSIVYAKMYLSKFVFFYKTEPGINFKNIIQVVNDIKNKNFAKVIKIYLLKLLYNSMNSNFEDFQKFEFRKVGIDFIDEFSLKKEDKKNEEVMLTYFFLPLDEEDYKKYLEQSKLFLQNINFDLNNKDIANCIKKDNFDIFICLSINKIISNLGLKNYDTKEIYQKFSNYIKSLFNDIKFKSNDELRQLLSLLYDSETYLLQVKPKLINNDKKAIDQKLFEALLYGFRFCVNSLDKNYKNKNEELLFRSMFSKNCTDIIDHSLIPGNDIKEDLHISTLETIEFHFKTFPDACGCYVCSCGFYYNIDPCGFPTTNRTFKCSYCGEKCGWDKKKIKGGAPNHGMVIRPGHYRLFRDKAQKEGQMKRWKDPDENIPNKLLEDYKKEVIDPIRNTPAFGFNSIERDFFENQNKKVRNLSNIGYRLLNFISYCHLFFSYCSGYISEENMNKYLIKNTDILRIIELDWNLLKESLQQKNIKSIQIFMNLIFKKLSKLISECKCFKTDNDRINFEKQVDDLINECIKEYPNYSKNYDEQNKKQLELDINGLKTFVTELVPPTKEFYPEKDYPMFNYFILTKYKTEEDMMKRMNNNEKYPLLNQLIAGNPSVKKLVNLPAFNEFTNYMVENYSFKISREDAKTKKLSSMDIVKRPEFNQKFNNFIKSWDEIKSEAKKYKCRHEMPVKNLSKDDNLICFLNDNGELLNGMYLASACQNFIEWQNTFLQPIVDGYQFNGILHPYVENIQRKIPVQDAKSDQIVLINERFSKTKYRDLFDVIYSFSGRNIFNEKGMINYSDYNSFVYDYNAIEEELGKILLPGVCQFEGEDDLNFITFWGEGLRGSNSEMLSKFYLKYPQKDLNEEEKEIIVKYINKMNNENLGNKREKYDFKEFFGSIQLLIFYLTQKGVMKEDEKLNNIISNAPGYFKLSEDCKNFFDNEGQDISVNKIMNLFFFFEHLCFEDLADTLQEEYKMEIPEDVKVSITNKLLKEKDPQAKVTIKDLGAATRRLISRYLAGKLQVTDVMEDRDLAYDLTRIDLWEEKIANLEDLEDIIINQLYEFKLKIGQAYAFYNLIGEEDRNSIISLEKGNKEEKKDEEINENQMVLNEIK